MKSTQDGKTHLQLLVTVGEGMIGQDMTLVLQCRKTPSNDLGGQGFLQDGCCPAWIWARPGRRRIRLFG